MSSIDELIRTLDFQQLANQVGADPADVEAATRQTLPTLLMGLDANASDDDGAASIERALADHDPALVQSGVDPARIDTAEGAKIAHHIFGANEGQIVDTVSNRLGLDSALIRKLLPILAPIVMAWLASKWDERRQQAPTETSGQPAQPVQRSGGILGDILGQVLGGQQQSGGGVLMDVLGSLLGGGRR